MKLFSSRVETDAEDIALLYREVGYHTVDEGLTLVERKYPPQARTGLKVVRPAGRSTLTPALPPACPEPSRKPAEKGAHRLS